MSGTILKLKQTAVAGREPTHNTGNSTDIEQGELALNTADQKLFSKDANGNIFVIGDPQNSLTADSIMSLLMNLGHSAKEDGATVTFDLN